MGENMAQRQDKILPSLLKKYSHGFYSFYEGKFSGWKQGEKILFIFLLFNIVYSFWVCVSHALRYFSTTYVAGELFISYAGGLVRRGLAGTILSFFADSACMPACLIFIMLTVYLAFIICIGKILFRQLERFWAIILLGSPGIFLFMGYGKENFLRKDILIVSAICAMLLVIVRAREKGWRLANIFLLLTTLYLPAFLIHELSLMFMGFPLSLLFATGRNGREKILIIVYALLLAGVSLLFIFNFSGTVEQGKSILDFWKNYFPDLKTSAIEYIGSGLTSRGYEHYSYSYFKVFSLRISIIKSWLLTFLPIVGFWYRYDINTKLLRLGHRVGLGLFMSQGLVAFLTVLLIMNDIGRINAFFSIILVASGLAVLKLSPTPADVRKGPLPDLNNYLVFILGAAYLYCWKIEAWVPLTAKTFLTPQFWQQYLLLGS